MILPDVDGNDLAAVLEFVYTGHTAVSGERLDSFSSTAEALKIDIPPIPRPLTLSCNESPLTTSEMIKCKRYYGEFNAGVNMTKRKLNENKSIGEIPLRILSQNNCLNFDDKYFNASREGLRPRFSVANRVSASPWCQILRPHNLPRLQPIIIRNNIPPGEDIIQVSQRQKIYIAFHILSFHRKSMNI
uniref:Lolal_4 protein n=1 Tax=Fopius arisanus TaxID=64838 RepID=A0A0C9RQU7_9HYME